MLALVMNRHWPAFVPGLFIALAFSVFTGASGYAETAQAAASDPSIHIIRNDYVIDYGEKISFALELSAVGTQVERLQAIYEPRGSRSVGSYAYPAFIAGSDVTASFQIATTGVNFFPPGTVFDVSYVITDAQGRDYTTDPIVVEYLDPEFDWQKRTEGTLSILYHDRSDGEIAKMVEAADARMPNMARLFGIESQREFKAVIVNSSGEASRAFPTTTKAAEEGHFFAGFAFDKFDQFVLWGVSPSSFIHELTHLMFSEAVPSPLATAPSWLNEGLAVYFESGSGASVSARLGNRSDPDDFDAIKIMNRIPGLRSDISRFYAKSGSFVALMIETYGVGTMTDLLRELNTGTRIGPAVEKVYERSLDRLDQEWNLALFDIPILKLTPDIAAPDTSPPAPAPEPTVGAVRVLPEAERETASTATAPQQGLDLLLPNEPAPVSENGSRFLIVFWAGLIGVITVIALMLVARRRKWYSA